MRAYAFQNLDGNYRTPYKEGDRLLLAWVGSIDGREGEAAAELVYELLNRDDRPNRYVAPSLSIGDVVSLAAEDGSFSTWAVGQFGFQQVPEVVPDPDQAAAYHRARQEAEDLQRPVERPEQEEARQRSSDSRPSIELGQPLVATTETDVLRNWLDVARARLTADSDAYADVDLIYNLYRAITGEDVPHPWEGEEGENG
jgi:hypothetical protein